MSERSPEFLNEYRNIKELQTATADYEINYTRHDIQSRSGAIEGADGVILEFIGNQATDEEAKEKVKRIADERFQYLQIIERAAKEVKPIFLVDMSTNNVKDDSVLNGIIPFFELALAQGLTFSPKTKKPVLTRRDFLKKGAKGIMIAYPITAIAEEILQIFEASYIFEEPKEGSLLRSVQRSLGRLNDAIHPEIYSDLIDTRNDLIAEKSDFIARILAGELNKRPKLSLFIGGAHTGIERSLQLEPEERTENLRGRLKGKLPEERFIVKVIFEPKKGSEHQKFSISIIEDTNLK